jgi:hypothetical protein
MAKHKPRKPRPGYGLRIAGERHSYYVERYKEFNQFNGLLAHEVWAMRDWLTRAYYFLKHDEEDWARSRTGLPNKQD